MKRRQFIAGLGGAAVWPVVARAQQPNRMRRVGVLMNAPATDTEFQSYLAAFIEGLRQLGWTEGQNLHVDVRWNAGDAVLSRTYAAQLIGLMPDVILAVSTVSVTAIQQVTSIVPVVFAQVLDPVAQGFVASMRQPGGNLTGFSLLEISLGGKWLDLLKNAAPGLERVAVMFNPDTSSQSKFFMQAIEAAASRLDVRAIAMPVRATADIEPTLASFARQPNGGLMLLGGIFARLHLKLIADLAGRYRLPSIGSSAGFAKEGGLMEYGPRGDLVAQFRQAATYVDRILKGSKPGDLPVRAPERYGLFINLKTAKALGIEVPGQFGVIQAMAPSLRVEVNPVNVRDVGEIERAVATFARSANGGLIVTGSPLAFVHRDLIVALAAQHKLPAVYWQRPFVTAGGLISYGASLTELCRRAAAYVDRILSLTLAKNSMG